MLRDSTQFQRRNVNLMQRTMELRSAFGNQMTLGRLKAMLLSANRLNPQKKDVRQQIHIYPLYHTPLKYIVSTMWIEVRRWFGHIGDLLSNYRW